jgi:hypothetical protein
MRSPALLFLAAFAAAGAAADPATSRVWEVNGIRLEADQVERLSGDIARQTVAAVRRVEGLTLQDGQDRALEAIYRETALDVYDRAVAIVNRSDLPDAEKEEQVKRLVLNGQRRSTAYVQRLLGPAQYDVYRAWEARQVEAFEKRGLWSGSSRGRRSR